MHLRDSEPDDPMPLCPRCGVPIDSDQAVCTGCGVTVQDMGRPYRPAPPPLVRILALLFLVFAVLVPLAVMVWLILD